jgi:hypothetical protein
VLLRNSKNLGFSHLRDPCGLEDKLPSRGRGKETLVMLLLLILIIVLLVGATPAWPYSRGWGYYPSGVLGTILVIFLVLLLLGQVSL